MTHRVEAAGHLVGGFRCARGEPRLGSDLMETVKPVVVHVVDDDEDLRQSLAFLLQSVGIEALTYPTATAFLEEMDSAEAGVVIVDVRMPGMSGFELQDELVRRGYPAPIIFCSAHGDIPMSVRALRAGAVDFLEKPYEPQRMLEVVQEQLRLASGVFSERGGARTSAPATRYPDAA